jgi:DNA-binding transcriptional MerR regulator
VAQSVIVVKTMIIMKVDGKTGSLMERRLTTGQVAHALGLQAATVQLYAREHRVPFDSTPGGHRRFNLNEVQVALAIHSGNKRTSAERQETVAYFGPSPRARASLEMQAVRTPSSDIAHIISEPDSDITDNHRSALMDLLNGALSVRFSAVR